MASRPGAFGGPGEGEFHEQVRRVGQRNHAAFGPSPPGALIPIGPKRVRHASGGMGSAPCPPRRRPLICEICVIPVTTLFFPSFPVPRP